MDLISALPADTLCLSTMSEGTGDEDCIGVYHDDMDSRVLRIYSFILNNYCSYGNCIHFCFTNNTLIDYYP